MTHFLSRLGGAAKVLPRPTLCDAWLADEHRFGDELPGLEPEHVLGRWPEELETDAAVRLAQAVGEEPTWKAHASTPAVAQKLAERARPQPLDLEILKHLQHLQHVCHRPRLHLRVEEERLVVSRARRTPVRAVADLVSHPGDWEHRTLRSIQPSRILARQIEDEWELYENRVAVRLVDNLLAYLAKRLEELRRIKETLDSRDYSDEIWRTSFRRASRISELWSTTLESRTEEELSRTVQRLELAQRDLQVLLDAPLYQRVPRRQAVALSLKPTNILVNDPHYRKVAALWRAWVKFGHKRQETHQQRSDRRQREAAAWDRFVLHLVIRAFTSLGWVAARDGRTAWRLTRDGWSSITVIVDKHGIVSLRASGTPLRLFPLCATLTGMHGQALTGQLEAWDALEGELVAVHVGPPAELADADRAAGWSFGGRAVMFGCSPWRIDSEERMARLLNGWLNRAAAPPYPVAIDIRALPALPRGWDWLRYEGAHLVALRAPDDKEAGAARAWASTQAKQLDMKAEQAKLARQAVEVAPRQAITVFQQFIEGVGSGLVGIELCPVCGAQGLVEPRPGRKADGADATWWAMCGGCRSEWGLRPCTSCGGRYRALVAEGGIDISRAADATPLHDWPDKVFGRDLWAQPCSTGAPGQFRCPTCGACSGGDCARCTARSQS